MLPQLAFRHLVRHIRVPYLHMCGASVGVWHKRSSSVIIVGVPRIFHFNLLAIRTYYIHILHEYTTDISLLACRIRGERFLQTTAAPVETALSHRLFCTPMQWSKVNILDPRTKERIGSCYMYSTKAGPQ